MRDNIAEFIKEKFSEMHREIFRKEKKSTATMMSLALIEKGKTKKNPMVKLSIKRKTHISINKYSQTAKERKTKEDIKSKCMANG